LIGKYPWRVQIEQKLITNMLKLKCYKQDIDGSVEGESEADEEGADENQDDKDIWD
jgi:hypothetical protein